MALSDSAGIGSALPSQVGVTSGYVLQTDGSVASWVDADAAALPAQTGHGGEYLTTDGTNASWAAVTADGLLPDQTTKSGYFLTTNGTTVSWGNSLTALLPTQTGNNGKVLSTDGSGTLSWIDAAGLALGAFSSTPSTDGLTLAAGTLNMDPADGTHAGGVSTTTQTFAGVKTFSDVPVAAGLLAPTTSTLTLQGQKTDGGTSVGVVIDAKTALTTSGAKIVSFQNAETEKAYIDKDGKVVAPSATLGTMAMSATQIFGASPGIAFSAGNYIGSGGGSIIYLGSDGGGGSLNIVEGGSTVASVTQTALDLTGMGVGIVGIKMKSPDGTTYTAKIANGGTWSIT